MKDGVIEYVDRQDRRLYRLWRNENGKLRCEALYEGQTTPQRITDLNAFSEPVFEILMRAAVWLYPQHICRIDPGPGFRFYDKGGCGGPCPEFAS